MNRFALQIALPALLASFVIAQDSKRDVQMTSPRNAPTTGSTVRVRSLMVEDYPILPRDLESIVGKGVWYYAWPHGLLPLEPEGFKLISGPFDYSKGDEGMTMNNWGMKTTYESNKDKSRFSVWVLEDLKDLSEEAHRLISVAPISVSAKPITTHAIAFHELKAGIGIEKGTEGKPPESSTVLFRLNGRLFVIRSTTRKIDSQGEQNQLLKFAEQLYLRNGSDKNKISR
jgi:hypothetical protein